MILVIVAVAVLGMPFIGFLSFMIAVILAVIAYYFIFPKLNVEYEYIILNHDLQIDAIYNKAKRKRLNNLIYRVLRLSRRKVHQGLNSYNRIKYTITVQVILPRKHMLS